MTKGRSTKTQKKSSSPMSCSTIVLVVIIIIGAAIYDYFTGGNLVSTLLSGDGTPQPPALPSQGVPGVRTPTPVPGQPTPTIKVGAPVPTQAGNQAGWYQLFFTRPIYPDRPENRGASPLINAFDEFLRAANSSIDMAIYELDVPQATAALVDAKKRGVQVRVVTDSDSINSDDELMTTAYSALEKAKIPIVADERSAIMHDKFVVVDKKLLWTGSWNFTEGDTYRLNNNAIAINSPELAANYSAEFARMFEQDKFGPSKSAGSTTPALTIEGTQLRNYFAPKDKIEDQLVSLVSGAQSSIYFMAFQFTQDKLGDAMAERAKAGVTVSGVFEKTGSETEYSEYTPLLDLGLPVYQDGNPYIMHHKVIIVDERYVAFGSYNFSAAAQSSNDENILIVDNTALAAQFVGEFNYVRGVAQNPGR